jgi:hypothetical protein
MFIPVYTKRYGRLNKRQTILKMSREYSYDTFTAWNISDAIKNATGGEVVVPVSLCDLVLRKQYDKSEHSAYFHRVIYDR